MDTDVLVALERRAKAGGDLNSLTNEEVAISVITVSELLHGVARADAAHRATRGAFVERLLERFQAVEITQAIARVHADLSAGLAGRGQMIGAHDLWIAASALSLGYGLASANVNEFRKIPGLRLVNPLGPA